MAYLWAASLFDGVKCPTSVQEHNSTASSGLPVYSYPIRPRRVGYLRTETLFDGVEWPNCVRLPHSTASNDLLAYSYPILHGKNALPVYGYPILHRKSSSLPHETLAQRS